MRVWSKKDMVRWPNGKASDYDLKKSKSGDCRFEPCGGHFSHLRLLSHSVGMLQSHFSYL